MLHRAVAEEPGQEGAAFPIALLGGPVGTLDRVVDEELSGPSTHLDRLGRFVGRPFRATGGPLGRCFPPGPSGRHEGVVSKIAVLPARLLVASLAAVMLAACGAGATATALPTPTLTPASTLAPAPTATLEITPTTPPATAAPEATSSVSPLWRYVNSGWGLPRGDAQGGVFAEQLRVFVITSQEALDAFQLAFSLRRSLGTTTSLGRVDFPGSFLLAAYYLWRPLQGDPLSVVGFSLDGRRADVLLELEPSPQGKEYPYLLAPMTMVTLDRSLFPEGERIEFVFQLDGQPQATVSATVN